MLSLFVLVVESHQPLELSIHVQWGVETGCTLGSPLIDGIFLVQKMCICSCVTLSTTLLMRAVQYNDACASIKLYKE